MANVKISRRAGPAGCLAGGVAHAAGGLGRDLSPHPEIQGPAPPAYVQPRHSGTIQRCHRLAVRRPVQHRLSVDLEDQISLAQSRAIRRAAQVDGTDAYPLAAVGVVAPLVDGEPKWLLLAPDRRRGRGRLP